MDFDVFIEMVKESVFRSWKQNCMGLKSSLDKHVLVDHIDKALQEGSPTEAIMNWMREVEDPKSVFHSRLKEEVLSKGKKCCFGWCPTLKSHHQLSMEADKVVQDVAELLKKIRRTYEEALSKTEQKVAAAAVKDFMYFDSRRDVWEEIMVALQSPRVSSIGVYGEAGVGKTMLVEEIKRKAQQLKLFDDVVMTRVTNNPDMRRIQDDIGHDLDLELPAERVTAADRIKSRLTDRKVLVILDDVWARIDLEEVGIPFGNKHRQKLKQPTDKKNEAISSLEEQTKCILLMTCRDRDVLSGDMDAHKIIKVDQLKGEEAWELFEKIAGEKAKNRMFQRTAKIDEKRAGEQQFAEIDEIVNECNQLPIAILTLASALEDKSLIQWRTTIKKHRLQRPSRSEVPISLYSAIKLRYDELESEELKKTLLLCSLMGHNAGIQDFLKYGIGLGLFPKATSIEEARAEALNLVKELRRSPSLLQEGGDNMHFDMHDLIQKVAISIASQEHGLLDLGKDAADEEVFDKKAMKECKWISLSNGDARVASHLPHKLKCPQLTFFHSGNKYPDLKIPDNFFKGADQLRVLGLTKMHFSSIPKSFSLLKNLHTLCLDQSKLGTIPVSIMGDLKNLQVLSLVGCDIEELPQETNQLVKLKLLDLSDCTELKVILPGILKSLLQLEALYLGNSFDQWEEIKKQDKSRNASLDELTQLKKLTSLEVRIPDISMMPDDLFSIELKRCKIFIGDVWKHWGSSFEHSKTLKLKHDESIRSDKVKQLSNKVEELHLEKLNGIKDVFNELDQNRFQELKCLHVKNIDLEIEHLFFNPKKEIYGEVLPKLEELFLHNLKGLQKIFHGRFEKASLKELRIITVTGCSRLKNLFSFSVAKQLLYLQEIRVADCCDIVEIVDDEEEEDANDITAEATDDVIKLATRIQCLRLQHLTEFISFSQEKIIRSRSKSLFNGKLVVKDRIWNLTKLIIEGCDQLENLFSVPIVACLRMLQHLEIRECKKMTEIIVSDPEDRLTGFLSLKQLAIENCPELNGFVVDKKTTSTALLNGRVYLPALETMSISKLKNLNTIWWEFNSFLFRSLNFLHVKDLPNLIRLCQYPEDRNFIRRRFECLKQLTIENCPQLNDSLFDEEFEFPELKIMTISHLENLKIIQKNLAELKIMTISHLENLEIIKISQETSEPFFSTKFEFPNLESLVMEDCHRFKYLKTLSIVQSFWQLKKLVIRGCEKMEEVIMTEKFTPITLFPLLDSMELEGLPELTRFCSLQQDLPVTTLFVFPKVKNLKLSKLPKLASFLPNNATDWPKLTSMRVCECDHVQIVALEFPTGGNQLESQTQHPLFWVNNKGLEGQAGSGGSIIREFLAVSFVNLRTLEISRCHGLVTLLRYTIAKRLAQLSTMSITDCSKLEEIVACEDDEVRDGIVFNQLTSLRLGLLSSLESFCSGECNFNFPSLQEVIVDECQKMSTFSKGVVKTEKLQKVKLTEEDDVGIWKDGDLNSSIQHLFINKNHPRTFPDRTLAWLRRFLTGSLSYLQTFIEDIIYDPRRH